MLAIHSGHHRWSFVLCTCHECQDESAERTVEETHPLFPLFSHIVSRWTSPMKFYYFMRFLTSWFFYTSLLLSSIWLVYWFEWCLCSGIHRSIWIPMLCLTIRNWWFDCVFIRIRTSTCWGLTLEEVLYIGRECHLSLFSIFLFSFFIIPLQQNPPGCWLVPQGFGLLPRYHVNPIPNGDTLLLIIIIKKKKKKIKKKLEMLIKVIGA